MVEADAANAVKRGCFNHIITSPTPQKKRKEKKTTTCNRQAGTRDGGNSRYESSQKLKTNPTQKKNRRSTEDEKSKSCPTPNPNGKTKVAKNPLLSRRPAYILMTAIMPEGEIILREFDVCPASLLQYNGQAARQGFFTVFREH